MKAVSTAAKKTLEAYERTGPRWTLANAHTGSAPVRIPPFDAVDLDLHVLFEA